MSVEQAFQNFIAQMSLATGDSEPVLAVTLSEEAMARLQREAYEKCKYITRSTFSEAKKITFLGVEVNSL